MFNITNRKVQGFQPVWAPFNGFSLLFDNPGHSYVTLNDGSNFERVNCQYGESETALYSSLWNVVGNAKHLSHKFLLCHLPLHSYHVTVWDGINDYNVHNLSGQDQEEADELLRSLPYSSLMESSLLDSDAMTSLMNSESITFKFEMLENWNNSGVVARVQPADSESAAKLKTMEKNRDTLNQYVQKRFGFATATAVYKPHVSVGYFANKEQGAQSQEAIEELNAVLEQELKDQRIIFSGISLYGMTDMATFIRKKTNRSCGFTNNS
ncbi:hypothetical protein [Paenibacillus sp. UNC451MF]|uniref:hypothetical protein n=1 Tax=Paenibacillus sp. UNC451MF TaxID=1449063 RepID=UPI00048D0952|nr:hypothetical protein [Paenibacillus sp. UNC451MF]